MMPDPELMIEEIREAVEKIVRRQIPNGVHWEYFPRPMIQHYDGKIEISLDAKATLHKEKVIEIDDRPPFLEIRFLRPILEQPADV